jgi:hypothetical protein
MLGHIHRHQAWDAGFQGGGPPGWSPTPGPSGATTTARRATRASCSGSSDADGASADRLEADAGAPHRSTSSSRAGPISRRTARRGGPAGRGRRQRARPLDRGGGGPRRGGPRGHPARAGRDAAETKLEGPHRACWCAPAPRASLACRAWPTSCVRLGERWPASTPRPCWCAWPRTWPNTRPRTSPSATAPPRRTSSGLDAMSGCGRRYRLARAARHPDRFGPAVPGDNPRPLTAGRRQLSLRFRKRAWCSAQEAFEAGAPRWGQQVLPSAAACRACRPRRAASHLGARRDHAAQLAALQVEAQQVPVEQLVGMHGEQQAIGGVEPFLRPTRPATAGHATRPAAPAARCRSSAQTSPLAPQPRHVAPKSPLPDARLHQRFARAVASGTRRSTSARSSASWAAADCP